MSASCNVCGRQVEVSDSGQPMPCECIKRPLAAFLTSAAEDCINAAPAPTRCAECGRLTDEWVRVCISEHNRAPACPDCLPKVGFCA